MTHASPSTGTMSRTGRSRSTSRSSQERCRRCSRRAAATDAPAPSPALPNIVEQGRFEHADHALEARLESAVADPRAWRWSLSLLRRWRRRLPRRQRLPARHDGQAAHPCRRMANCRRRGARLVDRSAATIRSVPRGNISCRSSAKCRPPERRRRKSRPRSVTQLQQKLGLSDRPEASVEIAEFRPIFLSGDVQTPGQYAYGPI